MTKHWPPIHKQPNRKDGSFTYYVDLRAVEGGRPGFSTLEEAETHAEQARIKRQNDGIAAFTLPRDVSLDAAKAHSLLAPDNVSILEAAKYFQKHVLAYKSAPVAREIVSKYIQDAEGRNNRSRTIGDKKSRLNAFAEHFGDSRLSEISLDELKDWIESNDWEPRTRINYLTKISQLYRYALRRKWVDANLTESIERPAVDETKPEIFTVDEAERLLRHAHKFGLLPYFALGFFAGVRSAELDRLKGDSIHFEDKVIRIAVAKKRSQRVVDMEPALLAWLEPFKEELKAGHPIAEASTSAGFRKNKEQLLEAAEIQEWKANGLRHSFGTYHLAHFQNEEKTAHQMGNSVSMVHNHYKALVTRAEAEKFWNLRPKTP
jgi:site-specific recombinase XerD